MRNSSVENVEEPPLTAEIYAARPNFSSSAVYDYLVDFCGVCGYNPAFTFYK